VSPLAAASKWEETLAGPLPPILQEDLNALRVRGAALPPTTGALLAMLAVTASRLAREERGAVKEDAG
jgi:hypothetical protein